MNYFHESLAFGQCQTTTFQTFTSKIFKQASIHLRGVSQRTFHPVMQITHAQSRDVNQTLYAFMSSMGPMAAPISWRFSSHWSLAVSLKPKAAFCRGSGGNSGVLSTWDAWSICTFVHLFAGRTNTSRQPALL